MTPLRWAMRPFHNYTVFTGRSGRSEFWWFVLLVTLLSFVAGFAVALAFGPASPATGLLTIVIDAALACPSASVTVRRLHDVGDSGWWILIGLVPLVGPGWLIVRLAKRGQAGSNRFGPNPNDGLAGRAISAG